jgi:hypothetical protein
MMIPHDQIVLVHPKSSHERVETRSSGFNETFENPASPLSRYRENLAGSALLIMYIVLSLW